MYAPVCDSFVSTTQVASGNESVERRQEGEGESKMGVLDSCNSEEGGSRGEGVEGVRVDGERGQGDVRENAKREGKPSSERVSECATHSIEMTGVNIETESLLELEAAGGSGRVVRHEWVATGDTEVEGSQTDGGGGGMDGWKDNSRGFLAVVFGIVHGIAGPGGDLYICMYGWMCVYVCMRISIYGMLLFQSGMVLLVLELERMWIYVCICAFICIKIYMYLLLMEYLWNMAWYCWSWS